MSSPSSTLPSPEELENLGVLFIGFVAATVLYGLTFFRMFSHTALSGAAENSPPTETYIYYSRYPQDHPSIRYLVGDLPSLAF